MNAKERLLAAIKGERTDRLPCICPGGMMNMITRDLQQSCGIKWPDAHTDPVMMANLATASYENGCFDNIGVPFCMTIEAESLGAKVTMGTDIYEPHVTEYAIDTALDWRKLSRADFGKGRPAAVLEAIRLIKAKGLDAPIIGNLTGPISVASSVMDPVQFYKELRKQPEACHEYLNFVSDELIEFARAEIKAGAEVIAISEPSGTGEILGPKMFEEYAVRYINRILDGIADESVPTIVHICGNMRSVYEQFNKVRSDVLSFDSAVGMFDARRELPDRILMGNVSTYAIEFSDPEGVARLTRHARDGGSNIMAPACGIGVRSPIENVRAMIAALEEDAENA